MNNQEAIDLLDNLIGMISDNQDSDYDEALKMGIKALKKNESAEEWYKLLCEKWDLSENKGEWRPIYQGDEIIDYRCSKCDFGSTFGRGKYRFSFCPNCGADMREEREEN